MSNLPTYAVDTIKRWIAYWRKFRGKRVQVYLRQGINISRQSGDPLRLLGLNVDNKTTIEVTIPDRLIGTITDIVENPFGIMLKDICIAGERTEIIDRIFIPMSEITKMDIFKKEAGQAIYDYPPKQKLEEHHNDK